MNPLKAVGRRLEAAGRWLRRRYAQEESTMFRPSDLPTMREAILGKDVPEEERERALSALPETPVKPEYDRTLNGRLVRRGYVPLRFRCQECETTYQVMQLPAQAYHAAQARVDKAMRRALNAHQATSCPAREEA